MTKPEKLIKIFTDAQPSTRFSFFSTPIPEEFNVLLAFLKTCTDTTPDATIAFELAKILTPHFVKLLDADDQLPWFLWVVDYIFSDGQRRQLPCSKLDNSFIFKAWDQIMGEEFKLVSGWLTIDEARENCGLLERRVVSWEIAELLCLLSKRHLSLSERSFHSKSTLLNIHESIIALSSVQMDNRQQTTGSLLTQENIWLIEKGLKEGTSEVIKYLVRAQLLDQALLTELFTPPYAALMSQDIREHLWDRLANSTYANSRDIWNAVHPLCQQGEGVAVERLKTYANQLFGDLPLVSYLTEDTTETNAQIIPTTVGYFTQENNSIASPIAVEINSHSCGT